ncbi:MAG TPA: hypothetical protein P5307_16805 [Pirellulaceae bacterium]|nr:hypothetical protein [Planctomycetales bacterium]HRX80733.1 hypothetical protein [Pirellulaceae bacterium]
MKKLVLAFGAVIGLGLVGMGTAEVQAASPFGLHFGNGRVHVDIGNPHRGYSSYYRGNVYGGHYGGHYGGGRGHYDYHDTTHYDWHPGQYYRHGGHYDYVPGHYDLHRSGHYDYHRGGHGIYGHR